MRILAIRGENLASLAEPFALEFEQEPLRSCGLFAITGETGAGKSTILDALCLALYDTFPRVEATEGSERAPDPSGELLAMRDPAPILRRGAGGGYAEVDFVARDGQRYRARCGLQRARSKAAGKLQKRSRSLWRIDATGAVIEALESGVSPVNRRIVELTDLTFDQFCRTALLAQGDFDAFLRADAGKRADLLEKITGAEIYGRLSQHAYEAARKAQENLEQLERRQGDFILLTEEDRAAREAEIETLSQTRGETESESAAIQNSLRRLENHAQALERLRQAETETEASTRALDELAPQAAQLERIERAEPLRTQWRTMRETDAAARRQKEMAALAQERAAHAQETLARADTEERAARLTLDDIQQKIVALTPVWEEAGVLDIRIAETQKHETQSRRDVESAQAAADAKRQALDAARAEQNENLRELEAAKTEAARCAPARPLAERLPEIDDWLTKRIELSQENDRADAEAGEVRIELDRINQTLTASVTADAQDRAERDALATQIAEREQALAALDEERAAEKVAQVGAEVAILRALRRPASDYARAAEALAEADRIIADRKQLAVGLTQELQALRDRRVQQAADSADAMRLGELAEAAADPHALQLRAVLDDGKPCPVCGALEHPFSQNAEAAHQLVAELQKRREAARHALDRLDALIVQTEGAAAAARAEEETAQRQHRAATAEIAQATQDYAALTASRPMSAAPSAINGAVSRIDELLAERESEAEALAQKLEAARRLRDERDRLIKRYNTTRDAMDRRQNERQSATTRQQKFVERAAQLATTLAHNGERIVSIDRSLKPFLDLCGLMTADLDRDPVSARARLVQASENHQKAQAILDRLTQVCGTLELRVATLTAEAQASADSFATLSQTYAAQCKTLKDLRAARARLLDGEATQDHRARHEEQRKALADAFEQKRNLRAAAGESAAAARSLAEESLREIETTAQALHMAEDAFLQACATAGLTQVAAESLLAAPQEEIFSLREQLRLAQERCAAARATIAARRQDVDASCADLPEAQQADLAARVAVLSEQLEAMSSRMGALREQISQDDTARTRAEGLSREIDAARATNKLWDEINAAIGSRSGDKFRRFAQSVTLDQLVALANQRLALLSPRYRLEKSGEIDSLGLQIVDRDLGDERRSTRSLSGGERFLASLALALALAGLEGRDSFVDTLFIDEGFGSLDSMTLDIAIDALESLQGQGRKVGVISHVDSLQQRISTKISVERRGGGLSVVRVRAPGWAAEA